MASGQQILIGKTLLFFDEIQDSPEAFFNPLAVKLKMYYITGGMPEVVQRWVETQSVGQVQEMLMNILNAYMRDFIKHPETREYPKITMIWDSLPSQLSRKNKKFLYNVVKKGARAREYEDALQWLVPQLDVMPRYWSRTNPPYEVDFVIQRQNDIIPIEVKAETNIKSTSLKKYAETYPEETKLRVRFSLNNLKFDNGVLNIPLFMADRASSLMGMVLAK